MIIAATNPQNTMSGVFFSSLRIVESGCGYMDATMVTQNRDKTVVILAIEAVSVARFCCRTGKKMGAYFIIISSIDIDTVFYIL